VDAPQVRQRAAGDCRLRHGRPAAVVMSHARFEALLERLADMADRLSVLDREGMTMDHQKLSAELRLSD